MVCVPGVIRATVSVTAADYITGIIHSNGAVKNEVQIVIQNFLQLFCNPFTAPLRPAQCRGFEWSVGLVVVTNDNVVIIDVRDAGLVGVFIVWVGQFFCCVASLAEIGNVVARYCPERD